MLIRDLRSRFKNTIPVSEGFLDFMSGTFDFYTKLNKDFFANVGKHVEAKSLDKYLQEEIKPRLFDQEFCKTIEKNKKQFLAESIKLEQFIEENKFEENFLNDLAALKKVSGAIYDLLQSHWEFFKYEKSVANNGVVVAFILEIDQIGIRWDSYLEKYLAISKLLKVAEGETEKEGFTPLMVQYHLPENTTFPIEMTTYLVQFLMMAYEFVIRTHGKSADENELEISTLEVKKPVNCVLMVPTEFVKSYEKFLRYCTVDVLKRETLLKYVMETVRLQQGVDEMPKATITNYQKKIAKLLNDLHPEGFLSVNYNEAEDSVDIMSALCNEMDRLELEYKDMLTGATDRLARNRKQNLADMTSSAIKLSDYREKKEADTAEAKKDEAKTVVKPPEKESSVKIDIKKKEHIGFLTTP